MNISIIESKKIPHIDELERDIVRFAMTARIDDIDYDLDVYVNRDNDDYIEFDNPDIDGFGSDDKDELFQAVAEEID